MINYWENSLLLSLLIALVQNSRDFSNDCWVLKQFAQNPLILHLDLNSCVEDLLQVCELIA